MNIPVDHDILDVWLNGEIYGKDTLGFNDDTKIGDKIDDILKKIDEIFKKIDNINKRLESLEEIAYAPPEENTSNNNFGYKYAKKHYEEQI